MALFALSACLSYGVMRPGQDGAPASGGRSEPALAVDPSPALPPADADLARAPAVSAALEPVALPARAEEASAPTPEAPAVAAARPIPVDPDEADPDGLRVITGRVAPGGTVAGALEARGVSPRTVHELTVALRPLFKFRRAQPGDFYTLIEDGAGDLLSFEFHRGRRNLYQVLRGADGGLEASRAEVPLERQVVQLAGIIESSLYESLTALGEGPDLVHAFADIFIWDFDFSTQTRPGDEFRMVCEKFYDGDGFVRYGQVLAARYRASDSDYTAVFFEDEHGYADYYTPGGNSVRRTFLRAPVHYSRISSRYSKSRLHPILKVRRPHYGVDYAAPVGTPVWAVGDGVVTFAGRNGGFGRLVKIRHNNGYVSYYGHLADYADGIVRGARVHQKQVIGHVGTSGLATGPHLDYRLQVGGRFVDPLKVRFPKGSSIPVQSRDLFESVKTTRLNALDAATPPLVLDAAM